MATQRLGEEWKGAASHEGSGLAWEHLAELEGVELARAGALASEVGYEPDPL